MSACRIAVATAWVRVSASSLVMASRLRVGDVVGYRSGMLHRVVLHRIVAIKDDRYVLTSLASLDAAVIAINPS